MVTNAQSIEVSEDAWPKRVKFLENTSASHPLLEACAAENLELLNLSDHEWRVGDRRCDERSPEKVLGYIEKSGSTFEV